MKIISESMTSENKEMLPQVIHRIFSVCKADINFPLKNKVAILDGKVSSLKSKVMMQMEVAKRAKRSRADLTERISDIEDRNQGLKNELLDFLGSE